jgi:hypothetical protein
MDCLFTHVAVCNSRSKGQAATSKKDARGSPARTVAAQLLQCTMRTLLACEMQALSGPHNCITLCGQAGRHAVLCCAVLCCTVLCYDVM